LHAQIACMSMQFRLCILNDGLFLPLADAVEKVDWPPALCSWVVFSTA
jgi:hypothetical protein